MAVVKRIDTSISMKIQHLLKISFLMANKIPSHGSFFLALSNKYSSLAIKLSRKSLIKLPRGFRRFFCRKCFQLLLYQRSSIILIYKLDQTYVCVFSLCTYCKKSRKIHLNIIGQREKKHKQLHINKNDQFDMRNDKRIKKI